MLRSECQAAVGCYLETFEPQSPDVGSLFMQHYHVTQDLLLLQGFDPYKVDLEGMSYNEINCLAGPTWGCWPGAFH